MSLMEEILKSINANIIQLIKDIEFGIRVYGKASGQFIPISLTREGYVNTFIQNPAIAYDPETDTFKITIFGFENTNDLAKDSTLQSTLPREITHISGQALTPRDWSSDFANITNIYNYLSQIGITNNALDVNIKQGEASFEVNLDAENDEVAVYGSPDGGSTRVILKTDENGVLQIFLTNSALAYDSENNLFLFSIERDNVGLMKDSTAREALPRNITQISGTALSGRDWSLDFAKLQNLDKKLSEYGYSPSQNAHYTISQFLPIGSFNQNVYSSPVATDVIDLKGYTQISVLASGEGAFSAKIHWYLDDGTTEITTFTYNSNTDNIIDELVRVRARYAKFEIVDASGADNTVKGVIYAMR